MRRTLPLLLLLAACGGKTPDPAAQARLDSARADSARHRPNSLERVRTMPRQMEQDVNQSMNQGQARLDSEAAAAGVTP